MTGSPSTAGDGGDVVLWLLERSEHTELPLVLSCRQPGRAPLWDGDEGGQPEARGAAVWGWTELTPWGSRWEPRGFGAGADPAVTGFPCGSKSFCCVVAALLRSQHLAVIN